MLGIESEDYLQPWTEEYRIVRPDGSMRWSWDRAFSIRDEAGHLCRLVGIAQDITERKQTAAALQKSEERFQLVTRATNDAIWDWDLLSNTIWWNDGVRTLFGYAADAVGPDVTWWYQHIHPDNRDRVVSGLHAVLDSEHIRGRMNTAFAAVMVPTRW
jgi:PAS domain-containing protein